MISDYQIKCATGFKNFGDLFDGNFGTELGCIEAYECEEIIELLNNESWYAVRDFIDELYDMIDDICYDDSLDTKTKDLQIKELKNRYRCFFEPF